ncbi:MAG: DUF2946 family protein [Hyphomicrobium sp.]
MVLALFVRSLVPVGFMVAPASADGQGLTIVICTGHGPERLLLDQDGKPVQQDKRSGAAATCPFAAAGALALSDSEPPLLATEVRYAAVSYDLAVGQFSETPKPGATSARGPPELV